MKLMRAAAVAGMAKIAYDQARKPENQARIKRAMDKARASRRPTARSRRTTTRRAH